MSNKDALAAAGYRPLRSWTSQQVGARTSPNFGPRRGVDAPDMVVLHYTAMASTADACNTLCNPKNEVSAHYLIGQAGDVTQLVDEKDRAWHAGSGQWGGVTDVNSHSIGIELSNTGFCPFAAAQMDALIGVLHAVKARWGILPERVIGHSDMAPGRKIDPGARFDWRRLALEGLAIWPTGEVAPRPVSEFRRLMQAFGYGGSADDSILLQSFRMRFRPRYDGPLDATDMSLLTELSARFPVDGLRPQA